MTSEAIVPLDNPNSNESEHILLSNTPQNIVSGSENIQLNDIVENEVGPRNVYLAFVIQQAKLGIAVYDQETCCLHVTEVWETDLRNFSNIQNAILQTRPTVIVTSSRTNEELIGILKKNGENETKYTVEILKSSDFSYEAAKGKMMLLQFSGIPENATPQERLLSLASRIDFENLQMVCKSTLTDYLKS
jgi:hypothetical protein